MSNSFSSFSFGCRVNQAEREELDRQMVNLGYTYSEENPDIYIINSCSVTHKAEREAKQLVYQIKRKYPDTKIVVTGCAATNWLKNDIKVPDVDYLVDNASKEFLATLISRNTGPVAHTAKLAQAASDKYIDSGRLIIKIQDGCQRFCSFCIVPYLRGLPKSHSINSIVEKINSLDQKTQEVILTAINTEAFGYDTKERFVDLVQAVIDRTDVPRISFGSIHPWSINDTFFDFYTKARETKRIVPFFHIPLQSGSDKMLGLMKRGYTRDEFMEKLNKLGAIEPMAFIGSDIIVGFLEETDKDFEDTYTFLEQTPISKFHIFRFSKRQQTAAFYLAKRLREPLPSQKIARAKKLAKLNEKKYDAFLQKHVGMNTNALFLDKTEGGYRKALLHNQIPVMVKNDKNIAGEIHNVKITDYSKGQLLAQLVS